MLGMWLWTPNLRYDDSKLQEWMTTLNAKNVALNAEKMATNADHDRMMALNAKLQRDSDSERQIGKRWWLWTPKLRRDGGSERQTENMALKAKLRRYGSFERQTEEDEGSKSQIVKG